MTALDSTKYVDTRRFATEAWYEGVELADRVTRFLMPSVSQGGRNELLAPHSSFGGVVSLPQRSVADFRPLAMRNPYDLVWFAFGWGGEWQRYAANAFRKLVPTAIEGRDSWELELDPSYEFSNPVKSADDEGRFPMGSFPYGGAKIVKMGYNFIGAAVSALDQREDDAVAGAAGLYTGNEIYKLNGPLAARSPI